MPLYTFSCDSCSHAQEVLCRLVFRDSHVSVCEVCGGDAKATGRPELVQRRDFSKGKYRLRAISHDGKKHDVNNVATTRRRSDA